MMLAFLSTGFHARGARACMQVVHRQNLHWQLLLRPSSAGDDGADRGDSKRAALLPPPPLHRALAFVLRDVWQHLLAGAEEGGGAAAAVAGA